MGENYEIEKHEVDVYINGHIEGQEQIMTQTVGIMYYVDDKIFVVYDERFGGDLEQTKNTVIIEGKQIRISKKGAVNANMIFEEGLVNNTVYTTFAGPIPLSIETKKLEYKTKENGVDIELRYTIDYGLEAPEESEGGPVTNVLILHARYKDGFILT